MLRLFHQPKLHRVVYRAKPTRTVSRLSSHTSTVASTSEPSSSFKDAAATRSYIQATLSKIEGSLDDINSLANWDVMQEEIAGLERTLQDEETWTKDPIAGLKVQDRLAHLRKQTSTYNELKSSTLDITELAGFAEESSDASMFVDLKSELDALQTRAAEYLTSLLFSEPTDVNSAYVDIRAGSGGTEACDWSSMLARMYTNWAYSRNYTVDVVDANQGDVTGYKSVTLLLNGLYAHGYAQYESGIHRLVRISPFDRANARHTSFASVQVSPHFGETLNGIGTELKPGDLKITTTRSQGAGGQHVNKTESAVRIVHLPTGLTVLCQQERSQHRNRLLAMSLLKSKLFNLEAQKQSQLKADEHSALPENAWGSQIRSYVLQPYQSIKDVRTGYEVGTGKVPKVLDGDVTGFMEASLRKFRKLA